MQKTLHIILRVCDKRDVHPNIDGRFIGKNITKCQLIKKCISSLVISLNNCNAVKYNISIINDSCSYDLLSWIKTKMSNYRYKIIDVPSPGGNNISMLKSYETALQIHSDIVYLLEDDYLHSQDAINEMIYAFNTFSKNLGGKEIAIAPTDDPLDYSPQNISSSMIVAGLNKHWRTNTHTTFTVMISKYSLLKNWDLCKLMSRYGENNINEDNTINLMYRKRDVTLFSPIPSLAAHMQYDIPILFDWEKIWNDIKE